jgi:hypothetical protein
MALAPGNTTQIRLDHGTNMVSLRMAFIIFFPADRVVLEKERRLVKMQPGNCSDMSFSPVTSGLCHHSGKL